MRAQKKRRRDFPLPWESRNEIPEPDLAARRVIRECLPRYLPTCEPELILDVIPGFFHGVRPGRPRPEINTPLDMSQSFLAGKSLPNLRSRRRRRLGAKSRQDEDKGERNERDRKSTRLNSSHT